MQFSDVLSAATLDAGVWTTAVTEDWMQGRSVFGGLQSAIALRAMRSIVPADVPLRVLQTTFVGPVPAGQVAVRAAVLRTGKNVTHVEARILGGAEVLALVVGVFGRARPSRIAVVPRPPEVRPRAPAHPRVPIVNPVAFAQHFTAQWIDGDLPFSGSTMTTAVIDVGMTDRGPVSEEHVVAIADVIPPLAFSLLTTPAPGSSLTWTLEMCRHDFGTLALEGWRHHAEVTAGRDGYTSQSAFVCAPDGGVAAISRQSMVVFG
jgi:hypothetical protein